MPIDKKDEKPGFGEPCEKDFIPGGLSAGYNVKEIAAKHGVPVEDIEDQLERGTKTELKEHTKKGKEHIAREIALDHLMESPTYYDFLSRMEKQMEKDYVEKGYGVEEEGEPKKERPEAREIKSSDSSSPEAKRANRLKEMFG